MSAPSAPSRSRIAVASFIGTAIEFYDFYIYGTAAALVFNKLFFPSFSATAGTLAALATFAVGFIARPVGAILFGHFGDRLGRKRMLIAALLVMGLSTVAIGLVPSYATIGVAAPIALVVLRFAQGIGLGGEWGGAVLLATEYAPAGKRGLYSAFPQLGPAVGFVLGNALFLILNATMSNETFAAWGWRVPFLASAVLLAVGYYIRMRIAETPVFQAAVEARERARVPFVELLRRQPGVLVLATLSFILAHTIFYTVTTFCLSYGTATLKIPRSTMLVGAIVAAAVMGVATLASAQLSDRLGRRRLCMGAAVLAAVWAFPLFALLQTGCRCSSGWPWWWACWCSRCCTDRWGPTCRSCSGCATAIRARRSPTAPVASSAEASARWWPPTCWPTPTRRCPCRCT
jgi:MFS family permease